MAVLAPAVRDIAALETREDVRNALLALLTPAVECLSAARARVRLGYNSAYYPDRSAEVEGFTRLLWGLVPLAAGSSPCLFADRVAAGLANGTDPNHPEFWGIPEDNDSRFVEAAAVGYALIEASHVCWAPLSSVERRQVAAWLGHINTRALHDNNWLFFRVLVNLGLRRVGAPFSEAHLRADLDRLESFHVGDGWYADGPRGACDYYNAFVFHYYGLIYARAAGDDEAARVQRFQERAIAFAGQFMHWFSPNGAAAPYGRSLVYRFAQAAFWSALAFVERPLIPWGVAKGLLLRHLRWWWRQPTRTSSGLLSIGYAYPNPHIAEQYVSPASPYWALKAFAALAVDETHPFWRSDEEPLPSLPATSLQRSPRMILCRDGEHVVALSGGPAAPSHPRHAAEKYAKFAYSTHFGFGLPAAHPGLEHAAPDSTLLLSEDREWLRGPVSRELIEATDDRLVSTWRPWHDVTVTTWLIPAGRWHVRVHRLATPRLLYSGEGGFALDRDGGDADGLPAESHADTGLALIASAAGSSVIREASAQRRGLVHRAAPNINVQFARSWVPMLIGVHEPGVHWLACAVAAWPGERITRDTAGPACQHTEDGIAVMAEDGRELLRVKP